MRVLFVCTGNIFRSLTAEYALRNTLGTGTDIIVGSAGTEDLTCEKIIDRIIELTSLLADRLVMQKSSQIVEAHPTRLYTKN